MLPFFVNMWTIAEHQSQNGSDEKMFKKLFKNKKGTVLTEALISMFILGTLFISIATAVTASITNTKRLQEVNETSAYAQKVVDCIYSIAESDSGVFFSKIEAAENNYLTVADFSEDCVIDLSSMASDIDNANGIGLHHILNDEYGGTTEDGEYSVRLYLLPSERADVYKSVNYFVSYNPLLTDNPDGGRIFNTSELDEIYTFKLVVSKSVNEVNLGTTNFIQSSPATVTYIFQVSSNAKGG